MPAISYSNIPSCSSIPVLASCENSLSEKVIEFALSKEEIFFSNDEGAIFLRQGKSLSKVYLNKGEEIVNVFSEWVSSHLDDEEFFLEKGNIEFLGIF